MSLQLDFFAASNSGNGFYSLFEQLYDADYEGRVGLIFGGPGTGKSTFCRRLLRGAAERAETVELLHCSSDPDSLDGIICRRSGLIVLDATPPHTVAPKLAGVIEEVINIGDCWDREKLSAAHAEIIGISSQIKEGYKSGYGYLRCAAAMLRAAGSYGRDKLNTEKADAYCRKLCASFVPKSEGRGQISRRFLSAVTPKGVVSYTSTVEKLCERIIVLDDKAGALCDRILPQIAEQAAAGGYDCYVCYDPLLTSSPRQVLIPELGLAICGGGLRFKNEKRRSCRRFYSYSKLSEGILGLYLTVAEKYVKSAVAELEEIKRLHDRLEEQYIPAMNYAKVNELAEKTVNRLLLKLPTVHKP